MIIEFTDIHVEGDFLCAIGHNVDWGTTHKVRVHLKKDLFEAVPENITFMFEQAIFHLRTAYRKRGKKLGTTYNVVYG